MVYYEWDPEKSRKNKNKHGISLEQAKRLFEDPEHIIVPARLVEDENRLAIIGRIDGKHWTCIATERGDVTRLISCRRSREKETKIYEEAKEGR